MPPRGLGGKKWLEFVNVLRSSTWRGGFTRLPRLRMLMFTAWVTQSPGQIRRLKWLVWYVSVVSSYPEDGFISSDIPELVSGCSRPTDEGLATNDRSRVGEDRIIVFLMLLMSSRISDNK